MSVSANQVKELRESTGAGMMDCKKALSEANGDMEKAVEILRKKGLKDVSKRAARVAAEGTIGMYLHAGGQTAAIVELNCETDFVARGDVFQEAARSLAMHAAAMAPTYLNSEEVPASVIEKEKEILLETLSESQKGMADKILPGKISKFYEENCLLNQKYIKDDSGQKSVEDVLMELSAKIGEKVTLRRFARFTVGEGVEKKVSNLADEVAATIGATA
jgi:elongation factor Ts